MRQKSFISFSRTAMMLLMMLLTTTTAWAVDGVSYVDANGTTQTANNVTEINSSNMPTTLSGWYVVTENVTYTQIVDGAAINLNGPVTIILANGCTMSIGEENTPLHGIGIFGFSPLTIYGQSLAETTAGHLKVFTTGNAIYYSSYTQHSGNVTVKSTSDKAIFTAGNITVNGGTLSATSLSEDAIYADESSQGYGNVIINGGQVTATHGVNGEGINANNGYGTITLGWTNTTDFIKANSYMGTVNIADGKTLWTDAATPVKLSGTNIAKKLIDGKKLTPTPYVTPTSTDYDYDYIDANGTVKNTATDGIAESAYPTVINSSNMPTTLSGWYVVTEDVTYTKIVDNGAAINLDGPVTIILANGCTMSIGEENTPLSGCGISGLSSDNPFLTIYGQSLAEADAGHLKVFTTGATAYAIEDSPYTQHSGNVTVKSTNRTIFTAGNVTVNGGTLSATSLNESAVYASNGNIIFNGGQVTATGSENAYGIIAYNGTITLGWTNADDFIKASKYGGTITTATGLRFVAYDGNTVTAIVGTGTVNGSTIGGKKLCPLDGYLVTSDDANVTSGTPTFTIDGTDYYLYASGDNVALGDLPTKAGYIYTYTVNGEAIVGTSFTITGDATVALSRTPDPYHFAVSGNEYTIHTATGWNVFCDCLQDNTTYNRFSGKTVNLDASIGTAQNPITRMAGSDGHEFTGTFNGGGNTLTVSYENAADAVRTAPFSYVDGATIQNLVVKGSITGSARRASGVIGETSGSKSYITNCVSSVTISSANYTSGFSIGGNVEIDGCVFNGTINGSSQSGGFVGYSNSALKIKNSLFAPKSGSSISGGTFYYNVGGENTPANSPTNSYYTTALGDAQGTEARSVNAVDGYVTVSSVIPIGDATDTYDVSGITAYAKGIKTTDGTFYYGSGDEVSLTLSHDDRDGYTFGSYSPSAGTLSGTTLTMPDADVTISATWKKQITITANSDTKTYDGTALTNSGYAVNTTLETGDAIKNIIVTGSQTDAGSSDNVPSAAVIRNGSSDDVTANYDITYVNGTLTVNPKAVTVTADNKTKICGDADPELTATVVGTIGSDVIDYLLSREAGEAVGTYTITVTPGTNANYTLTPVAGTFSITPIILSESTGITTEIAAQIAGNGVQFTRTFTADKASTICLPFTYTPAASEGTYYTFAGIEHNGNEYVATMQEANTAEAPLTANTPYVFMPTATGEVIFSGVATTIPDANDASALTTTSDDGNWTFKGTYSRLEYKDDGSKDLDGWVYGFASKTKDVVGEGTVQAGEFVHAKDGASVPPMRCYLMYNNGQQFTGAGARGMTRADEDLPQTITVRFVSSHGEVTSIGTLNTQTGEIVTDGWYTLNGTRLNGKPSKRGIYINNGRKIVIK